MVGIIDLWHDVIVPDDIHRNKLVSNDILTL